MADSRPLGSRRRLRETEWSKRWGWQMFSVNTGTGAIAIVIASIPYAFRGQHAIGAIFFVIDLVVFFLNVVMITLRVIRYPSVFAQTFLDQKEGVWFPMSGLAVATILINILLYGVPYCGPWLVTACEVLFWIFVFLAAVQALIVRNTIRTHSRSLEKISPPDALEIYPVMFIGVVGATLVPELVKLDPSRALVVWIFAYIFQGLGLFIGILKLSVWMTRDMVYEKASESVVPGFFIAIGIPGFTSLTLVDLGHSAASVLVPLDFLSAFATPPPDSMMVALVFGVTSLWFSFLTIGFAAWLMLIFLGAPVVSILFFPREAFSTKWAFSWWSMTFPFTGPVVTFARYAKYFPSKGFGVLNIIFVFLMTLIWLMNALGTVRLIWRGDMMGTTDEFDRKRQRLEGEDLGLDGLSYHGAS